MDDPYIRRPAGLLLLSAVVFVVGLLLQRAGVQAAVGLTFLGFAFGLFNIVRIGMHLLRG